MRCAGAAPAAQLHHDAQQLRQLLRLARFGGFYLLYEADRSRLVLLSGGAVLREFAVLAAEVRRPRVARWPGSTPGDWMHRLWRGGRLHPARTVARVELVPPSDLSEAVAAYIPPPPEELIPAPPRFRVRYRDGWELEVVADRGGIGSARSWLRRAVQQAGDLAETAFGLGIGQRPRLRLVLPAAEAGALYRSLPEETAFYLVHTVPCRLPPQAAQPLALQTATASVQRVLPPAAR